MKLLDRLLHRSDHKEWLTRHPGKGEFHLSSGVEAAAADQKATRERMEQEMKKDADHTKA